MYIVVCMCIYYYIVYTFINNQRTSISKLNFFDSAHSSSVNKCKQISWMCFIVIYLFYIFFILVFFSTFPFVFYCILCNATSAIALSVAVVSGNCFICVIWVCECVWVSRVFVCVSVPIVCLCETNSFFFLRASLKFLETRPLRMFSNYKQFQCSSSARKWQIVAIVIVFLFFISFFALPNKSYTHIHAIITG